MKIRWCDQVVGAKLPSTGRVHLRQLQTGPGIGQVPFSLMHSRPVSRGIQLRDHLPGFDLGVVIDQ